MRALIEDYRERCLWFLREDFYPATADEALKALDLIQRQGDVKAFRRAADLKRWLLLHSSGTSRA